jgi:hypothetical protein
MKTYPSIPKNPVDVPIYAFDKMDGSQIRAEWDKKKGFWKFGSRKRLLGEDQGIIAEAEQIIQRKYASDLGDIFKDAKHQKAICFFEFYGPNSFAGTHSDEEHDVVLFDVNPHKKGILNPHDFIKEYGHLHIPKLLYHGNANNPFIDSVKEGTLEGVTFEGVVCKGVRSKQTVMFKIKSAAWLKKLHEYCKGDDKLIQLLS